MFAKIKKIIKDRNASFYRNFDWHYLEIKNGQFHTYCINMYGKSSRMKRANKLYNAVPLKPVLSGHSKIDKTKVLVTNGSLMRTKVLQNAPL